MKIRKKMLDIKWHQRYNLSNGGHGVINSNGQLVAYNKNGKPDEGNWDWVRKDYQAEVDKRKS